jgi:hypothetical protein
MLLCKNGPQTSLNQFSKASNRCEELIVLIYILSLGQHAVDIFEGLEKESESLQNRTQDLNKRIVSVEETLKVWLFVSSHLGQERASNFELEKHFYMNGLF